MSVAYRYSSPDPRRAGITLALALLAALGFGLEAEACELRLARAPATVRIDYDPFAIARPPGRLDLELVNDGGEPCELELRLLDVNGQPLRSLDLGGAGVGFRAREGSALAAGDPQPNRFRLVLAPGAATTAQLDAFVGTEAVVEAGEHRAIIRAEIGPESGPPLIRIDPLEVVLASPPRAQMNIAGVAGAFGSSDSVGVIDFGDGRTGSVKRAFLQVRANTQSRLTFQSEHAGTLRRPGSLSEESVIDYSVTLDGRPVDLRHASTHDVDPPRDLAGVSLPLEFQLGVVGHQMAGRYEDLLTISISPN